MSEHLRSAEDVAQKVLGCHVETVEPGRTCSGQRYCGEHYFGWLSDVDMCPRQERLADVIRAYAAEVAARAWDEGYEAGDDDAASFVAHHFTPNPYRAGGE